MTFTDKQKKEKSPSGIAIYENQPYAQQAGKITENIQVELVPKLQDMSF